MNRYEIILEKEPRPKPKGRVLRENTLQGTNEHTGQVLSESIVYDEDVSSFFISNGRNRTLRVSHTPISNFHEVLINGDVCLTSEINKDRLYREEDIANGSNLFRLNSTRDGWERIAGMNIQGSTGIQPSSWRQDSSGITELGAT